MSQTTLVATPRTGKGTPAARRLRLEGHSPGVLYGRGMEPIKVTVERREFRTPQDLSALKEKVVINCPGYGARALWRDESIVPVRGQIAWLIPQPEVNYGLYYKHVSVLPRRDGIVVQYVGETEAWGYNDDNETASRAEAESAIAAIASLYGQAKLRGA